MSTASRSFGLLDVLSSTPAEPSIAMAKRCQMRLVSMPVCASSLRNLVRKAGWQYHCYKLLVSRCANK
jgi:hypothetical protein